MLGRKNISFSSFAVITFVIAVQIVFSACNTVKYVPENKYLLNKNIVELKSSTIDYKELEQLLKQKNNKRIFGARFHLGLYNLSNPSSEGRFSKWFRKIGEEPVIFDEILKEKSNRQLSVYLKNKGYYNAKVTDTVLYRNKEVIVKYKVDPGKPYIIRKVDYLFNDSVLKPYILSDSANTLIKSNSFFDVDILQNERQRIENNLKNKAFYTFSKEDITYQADTTVGNFDVNLQVIIQKIIKSNEANEYQESSHKQFKVRNINVIYKVPLDSFLFVKLDTISINNIQFKFPTRFSVNPLIIAHNIYITSKQNYSLQSVDDTYRGLASLKVFKYSNIQFTEVPDSALNFDFNWIDCNITLSSQNFQSYQFDIEGTTSSGPGIAGRFVYQHKNIFGSAELFNIRLKAATEALKKSNESVYTNTIDVGAEASLQVPKFMLPFRNEQFIKKYNPRTLLSSAYHYIKRPEYAHTVANITFGYLWKNSKASSFQINPFDVNVVKVFNATDAFKQQIQNTFLKYSFTNQLVAASSISYTFNSQNVNRNQQSSYFRVNAESAGSTMRLLNQFTNASKNVQGYYQLFDIQFAQYIKGDVDFHYNIPVNESDKIAYRFIVGAALPYNNSKAIPFVKQFYSGGANSIRAWAVRDLGPGSFKDTAISSFPNKTADIKLETNIEYRFKLIYKFEGALFIDAGNIWAINKYDDRKGALFSFKNFYKEIAIGSGLGLRLDLSFFIIRVDLGFKVRNPAYEESKRWVFNQKVTWDEHFNPVIGINYPF